MTDREIMKLALEALNRSDYLGWQLNIPIIKALRQALEQPERTCIKDLTKQCVKENGHCYMGVHHD